MSDHASSDHGVAVLGLGNLGAAMALRLHEQGFTVRGYDVSPAARGASAALGLTVADDVAGAARGASAVCVVVGTAAQASACIDDLLRLGGDATVLVHATLAPADVRALAERVGDRLLDAPVSGGPDRARAGSLAVMVGGDPVRVAAAREVLDALGRVLVTGAVGTAQVAKLVGQVVFMTTQGALLEGERLAAAYDVDWRVVLASLAEGTADSFAVREWGFFDAVAGAYDASGLDAADRPWAKDLRTALACAADRGVALPLTAAASRLVPPAIDAHARETPATDVVDDH